MPSIFAWLLTYAVSAVVSGLSITLLGLVLFGSVDWELSSIVTFFQDGLVVFTLFVGIFSFAPAFILNGIWEICGFHPSTRLVAGLGATVGTLYGLPLINTDEGWRIFVSFTVAGALGGFTLSRLRKTMFANKRVDFLQTRKATFRPVWVRLALKPACWPVAALLTNTNLWLN